jgi:hypothetical protein
MACLGLGILRLRLRHHQRLALRDDHRVLAFTGRVRFFGASCLEPAPLSENGRFDSDRCVVEEHLLEGAGYAAAVTPESHSSWQLSTSIDGKIDGPDVSPRPRPPVEGGAE